ncbi:MAG: response regulator transcription factor [Chloroflexi bacterium]|nr:response regulator transcription factor [Chloroflexota bacterium]
MCTKRVVLLSNHSLLAAGVQRLLQGVDSLELSIVAAKDPEAILKLRRLTPEVIVLDSSDPSLGEGVIPRMLEENPHARVVALNLNRSDIEVYRVRHVLHTDLNGLLEAIRGKAVHDNEKAMAGTDDPTDGRDGGEKRRT